MKRYVRANTRYTDYETIQCGDKQYSVHYSIDSYGVITGQVTEIHPYDDADYVWAKIDDIQVKFILDGRVIDKMTMYSYDDEDYTDIHHYALNYFADVALELNDLNKDIQSRMVHY